MTDISIIVPVYNAEAFLPRCIESVQSQSLANWELLLVDDGSTDGSAAVCRQFAESDQRIRLLQKPNGGASSAKNHGIGHASGEWLIFLDSDDFWTEPTALQRLLETARLTDADIVRGDYLAVDPEGNPLPAIGLHNSRPELAGKSLTPGEFLRDIIAGEFFFVLSLIRRAALNGLRFDTSRIFLEDMKLYVELLQRCNRCVYLPLTFYASRKHPESVSSRSNPRKLADSFALCDFFAAQADAATDSILEAVCRRYAVMMYVWTIDTVGSSPYFSDCKSHIRSLSLEGLRYRTRERLPQTSVSRFSRLLIWLSPRNSARLLYYKKTIREAAYRMYIKLLGR